jgi:hypothetical protein
MRGDQPGGQTRRIYYRDLDLELVEWSCILLVEMPSRTICIR